VLRTEDECVNEFYRMGEVPLDCGPESVAVTDFWGMFLAYVRGYEKRVELPADCDGGDATTKIETGETFLYQSNQLVGHYTMTPEELASYNKEGEEAVEKPDRSSGENAQTIRRFPTRTRRPSLVRPLR
jgi:hypothetical protein